MPQHLARGATDMERGLTAVHDVHAVLRSHVEALRALQATLEPTGGTCAERHKQVPQVQEPLQQSADPVRHHMGRVMASLAPGLFVGGEAAALPQDTLDLERWFRPPKGHARRMHGPQHAGVRLIQEGPTL